MNKAEIEKSLKRFLKRKVGYSFALLVAFMISGEISLAVEENNQLNAQKVAEKTEDVGKKKSKIERTEGNSWQIFFSTFFEKRKAKKYDSNGFKGRGGSEDITRPDIKIPDDAKTPDRIDVIPPDSPDISITEPEFVFKDPVDVKIDNIHSGVDINIDKDTVNIAVIDENTLKTDNKVELPETPKDLKMEIDLTDVGDTDIVVNAPTVSLNYDPNIFKAPNKIEVEEIKVPETFSLVPVQIKGEGIEQDQNEDILPGHPDDSPLFDPDLHETPIVIKNYINYAAGTGENAFYVNFSQNDIYYTNNPPSSGYDYSYSGTLEITGKNNEIDKITTGDLRDYYYNDAGNGKLDTPTGIFISDFISADTTVSGDYNLIYKIDGKPVTGTSYLRTFFSLNPHGLYNIDAGAGVGEGWYEIKIANFTGNLNMTTEQTTQGMNGNLIGFTHQTWDKYSYGGKNYVPWQYMTNYSVLLNSGTINLGASDEGTNGKNYSENMIGIMINVDQSNKTDTFGDKDEKTENNKTINAGNGINIYGSKSVGISFEEYISKELYEEDTRLEDNIYNDIHYEKKGHYILRDDAYIGNINVKGKNNYAFRMGNIFDELPDYNVGKYVQPAANSEKNYEEMYKYEFATYFDRVKVIGTVDGNEIKIENGYDNSESQTIKNYTSKIKLAGNSNAGLVIGKSLSSNAKGYEGYVKEGAFDLEDEYRTWGLINNNWDNFYNNPDAYWDLNTDMSKVNDWLNKGTVNPIANFEGIKIEVGGENNIGFIRDKDYSDNNKNDMIIDDKNITDIHFTEDARDSVLLRSEQYGITMGRDFEIKFEKSQNAETTTPADDDYKNIVMQATAQSWIKEYEYDKSNGNGIANKQQLVNSVGTVTNNQTISGTDLKNVVAMMASGYAEDENDGMYDGIGVGNENKNATQQARVINKGKIELTGSGNIGMAVLDNNLGKLIGTTENKVLVSTLTGIENNKGKNTAVYNTGDFTIENADIISSGDNSVGIYNTVKEYTKTVNGEEGDQAISDGKVIINAGTNVAVSDGAIGIYSSNGIVTAANGLILNSTTEEGKESSGAGIYAVEGAEINLTGAETDGKSNLSINIENGVMGIGAIGTKTDATGQTQTVSSSVNIMNGDISYSGKGYALYVEDGGQIKLDKDSILTLSGDAYGYNIDNTTGSTAKVTLDADTKIIVNSNNVTIATVIDKDENRTDSKSNYKASSIGTDLNIPVANIEANGFDGYKIAAIDGGKITIDGDGVEATANDDAAKNMEFLEKYKFQRVNLTVAHNQNINMKINNTTADTYFGGEVTGLGMSASDITGDALKLSDTSITLEHGANIVADRIENLKENGEDKSSVGIYI